jgi:hypothetical protein
MVSPLTPWVSRVLPVADGEEVRQAIANRYPSQLDQRTLHLWERLNALQDSEALYLRRVALASTVLVGHAVYWHAAAQEYRSAIAALTANMAGELLVADSAYAVGLVVGKENATRGDIIQMGALKDFDFTNAIGTSGATPAEAGAYYLSANTAGRLTKQRPPVGVYVAFLRGDGSAQVNPTPREVLEDHIHYAFQLHAQPAGTVYCADPSSKYVFESTSDLLPGWLPANHVSFGGLAPVGAKYGYNLRMHPELERIWPPMPANSAYLEADGQGVAATEYLVDVNGLWWFNDCYGKAPWSIEVQPCAESSSSSSSSSSSMSSSSPGECNSGPGLEQMGFLKGDPFAKRMSIYFVKMVVKTNQAVVTRLRTEAGSPLFLKNPSGEPAETGDLTIGINLALSVQGGGLGYQVLKTVSGNIFKQGPMVEGILAGSNIQISPVAGAGDIDANGVARGRFTLNAVLPGTEQQEGQITLVALDNVLEDKVSDLFVLSLPVAKASSFRAKIELPGEGLVSAPKMRLWFWLLSRSAGVFPDLPLSYRRLARTDLCTRMTLPVTDVALANLAASVCGTVQANKYIEVVSDPFDVSAGEAVFFSLGRTASDSYPGSVSILRMGFRISAT